MSAADFPFGGNIQCGCSFCFVPAPASVALLSHCGSVGIRTADEENLGNANARSVPK